MFENFIYNGKDYLYNALYEYIKEQISKGRIEHDSKIMSIRELAKTLNISRTTVENAYNQLLIEGYLYSKPQKGYYIADVSRKTNNTRSKEKERLDLDIKDKHHSKWAVDEKNFDLSIWKRCVSNALYQYSDKMFGASSLEGEESLRREIAKNIFVNRGVICKPEQIIIGAGVQILANILAHIFRSRGFNKIAFEDPGFADLQHSFKLKDFDVSGIEVNKTGINIKELIKSRCGLCIVTPNNQFPTGHVMPISKRISLIQWAEDYEGYIIEDDYDSYLRYVGKPIPSLQGLDQGQRVIYLGSFSTITLKSIRISYMVLPRSLLDDYNEIKHYYKQTASMLEQYALALYMKEGYFDKHIKRVRRHYSKKLRLLLEEVKQVFKTDVNIYGIESGTSIILELPYEFNQKELIKKALKEGIRLTIFSSNSNQGKIIDSHKVIFEYTGYRLEDFPLIVYTLKNILEETKIKKVP